MRVSGIARVDRSRSAPVDPVSWYEAARVQPVQPDLRVYRRDFAKVMAELEQELTLRKLRVIEVVFAPGVRPGIHWIPPLSSPPQK